MAMKPLPGTLIEDQPDPVLRRLLVWSEARGESPRGQLAVLWVVYNRAKLRKTTMKQEILRPLQFSAFNKNDPNRIKMLGAYIADKVGWGRADVVCSLFEEACAVDPTDGSLNYYRPLEGKHPAWGRGHKDWVDKVEIGNHIFGTAG
jgi:spore germination cell wall hydrolase CwlJ-like protein